MDYDRPLDARSGLDTSGGLGQFVIEALRLLQMRRVTDTLVPGDLGSREGGHDVLGHRSGVTWVRP